MEQSTLNEHPELLKLYECADYTEHKTIKSTNNLRRFLAGFVFYSPRWLNHLFRLRSILTKILKIDEVAANPTPQEEKDICFLPGETCSVYTILFSKNNEYAVLRYDASHLKADIVIALTPISDDCNFFEIDTIVHYKHWTGRIYFILVRPFHHIIFSRMIRAGATN